MGQIDLKQPEVAKPMLLHQDFLTDQNFQKD